MPDSDLKHLIVTLPMTLTMAIQSLATAIIFSVFLNATSEAQTPPSEIEYCRYNPFFTAIYEGDVEYVNQFIQQGIKLEQVDNFGRTALLIAAYQSNEDIFERLVKAGSNVNAFENFRYDAVTIAAVANDIEMLQLSLKLGGNPKNITSPYDGTALIAATHLGYAEVVKTLLAAGSDIDHINNLGWTALLEAIILGDGSQDYVTVVKSLLEYGADITIPDQQGVTALMHSQNRGYKEITELLE